MGTSEARGRKRKRPKYTTTTHKGLKITDHDENDAGDTTFYMQYPSPGGPRTISGKEEDISPTIVRNYKNKNNLI